MPGHGRPKEKTEVKLFEHADFEQSILRAAEHFRARGFRAATIEKDYYVTEALRSVAGGGAAEVANRGLVEAGTARGREPTATVELRSYLGQLLHQAGLFLGRRRRRTIHDAPAAFPPNVCRENVCDSRQGRVAQARSPA